MRWDGLIARALLKYGYSNFKLEILEYCLPEDVIKREQYYMDILQPEYNILRVAGSSFGYKHSDEARSKMSTTKQGLKRSDETRTKISTARQGLKHSDEIRAKMSARARGRKFSDETLAKMKAAKLGRKHSDETRAKMSATKSKTIVETDLHTNEIKE